MLWKCLTSETSHHGNASKKQTLKTNLMSSLIKIYFNIIFGQVRLCCRLWRGPSAVARMGQGPWAAARTVQRAVHCGQVAERCGHGYWNRVRQSYNSTILVILASVRCLRHNSRYSTQRIGHRSQSCLEGQIDSSDVRHVQIFPVPYRPFICAQASLRYLIDYLDCTGIYLIPTIYI